MTHQQRLFFLLFLLLLLPLSCLFAQRLTFTDILKMYHLDSSAARQYGTDKKLNLSDAGNTGSSRRYRFTSGDSSVRLQLSYPNDSTSLNVQLNYWFTSTKDYIGFKEAFRNNGFTRKAVKDVEGSLPSHVERYIGSNLQVELIKPGGRQPYWLFLHPIGNYTW